MFGFEEGVEGGKGHFTFENIYDYAIKINRKNSLLIYLLYKQLHQLSMCINIKKKKKKLLNHLLSNHHSSLTTCLEIEASSSLAFSSLMPRLDSIL
jgi:hypothetical protein